MQIIIGIIVGLFTGAISSAAVVLLVSEQHIDSFRRRMLAFRNRQGLIREELDLEGEWHLRDWRDDPAKKEKDKLQTISTDVKVYQSGNAIRGTFTSRNLKYQFSGSIEDRRWFIGTWSETQKGFVWHGTFLFEIGFRAETMQGRWLGVNRHHQLDSGEWEWKRPHVADWPSEAAKKLLSAGSNSSGSESPTQA